MSERYDRQLGITGWGKKSQEKIKNTTVFVCGAGGLGSPVLYYLCAAGIGNLSICDYDTINISNLNRQILHKSIDVGLLKVKSAKDRLLSLNPDVNIKIITEKINKKNYNTLVEGSDFIVDCLDNFKTRHILNLASIEKGIPLIHGGVSQFQGQLTFLSPPETPCLACIFPQKDIKEKVYVTGAMAGIIGAMQANEAIKYITGIGSPLKNKLLFVDGKDMNFETIVLSRNPKCKICSKLQTT